MTAPCTYETYRGTRFFSGLDGLRCIGILAVIWHHAGVRVADWELTLRGHLGVDLFFVISGFLITTLLLREQEQYGQISLKAFYLRRSLRIFPLYYTVVALYIAAVWLLERQTSAGRQFFANLPYFLSYTSNWFVDSDGRVIFYFSWSLAAEEQFYLIWPAIEQLLRRWRAVALIAALLVAQAIVGTMVAGGALSGDEFGVVVLLGIHPAILGGVVMAHVLHEPRTFDAVGPLLGARWVAPLLLVGLLLAINEAMARGWIWLLMVLLVGSVAIRESNGLSALLTWRPFAFVGVVSYGMYLLHMLCMDAVEAALASMRLEQAWLVFPATVALSVLAAAISYRYYESRFLRLKSRFAPLVA